VLHSALSLVPRSGRAPPGADAGAAPDADASYARAQTNEAPDAAASYPYADARVAPGAAASGPGPEAGVVAVDAAASGPRPLQPLVVSAASGCSTSSPSIEIWISSLTTNLPSSIMLKLRPKSFRLILVVAP
jgi:hypothetical protein